MRTVAHVGLAFVLVLIAACSGGAETTEVPTAAGAADDESAIVALPRSESDLALDTADLVLVGIGSLDQPVDAVRAVAKRFKQMMTIEEDDGSAPADVRLGDIEALQGVVKYPVRIKCAVLGWNTLLEGLDTAKA